MSTVQGGCTRARRRRRSHALPRRKTVRWSSAEVDGLLDGVREHGVGKWAAILRSSPCFNPVRTSVDLKDKWRNLAAHVRALALQSSPSTNGATVPNGTATNASSMNMSNISNVSSPPRRPRSDDITNITNSVPAVNGGISGISGLSNISGISSSSPSTTLSRPILIPKTENPLEPLHPPPNALQHVASLAPLAPHPHSHSHAPPPFVTNGRMGHVYTTRVLAPLPVSLGQVVSSHVPHDDGTVHHHMSLHNTELPLNNYFGGDFGNAQNASSGNPNNNNAVGVRTSGAMNVNNSALPTGNPTSGGLPAQMHSPAAHHGAPHHIPHHAAPHHQQHHAHHTHHDAVPTAAGTVNDTATGGTLSFDPFPETGEL